MNVASALGQPSAFKAVVGLLVFRALLGVVAFAIPVDDAAEAGTVLAVGGVFVVLSLVFAYFIWNRRRWAAWGATVLMVLDILLAIPEVLAGMGAAITVAALVVIVVASAVIVLLRHRTVWPLLQ